MNNINTLDMCAKNIYSSVPFNSLENDGTISTNLFGNSSMVSAIVLLPNEVDNMHKSKEKRKQYMKEYFRRPEVKAMRKPYLKEYYQKPNVKAKKKEYRKEYYKQNPNYNKEYYQKNKNKLLQQAKEHNQIPEIKARIKETRKGYYKKNKDKLLQQAKEHRKRPEVKARLKKYCKQYYEKNKEKPEVKAFKFLMKQEYKQRPYVKARIKLRKEESDRKYREKNQEKLKEDKKKWYEENKDDVIQRSKEHHQNKKQIENQNRIKLSKTTGIRIPLINEDNLLISETKLYTMIKYLSDGYTIQKHKRFSWLGRQHIDIYFPEIKTGIEYDGMQHKQFRYLFHRKNLNKFLKQLQLDQRKDNLCKENNINLIRWGYKTPITEQNVIKLLTNLQIPMNQNQF